MPKFFSRLIWFRISSIAAGERAAFGGVEQLRRMEAEHRESPNVPMPAPFTRVPNACAASYSSLSP